MPFGFLSKPGVVLGSEQGQDAITVKRGLEGEVEAAEHLDGGQLPMRRAVLMRLFSHRSSSSESRMSIASSTLISA